MSELLRPARRASVFMWVFAGLCICFGLCMAGFSRVLTPEVIGSIPQPQADQLREQIRRVEEQIHLPFQTALLFGGLQMLIPAFAMGAMAFWVRRGGRAAAVVSTVMTGFFLALVLFQLFVGAGGAQVLPALCAFCVPIVLLGATLKSLIDALRNAPQLELARGQAPMSVPRPGDLTGGWAPHAPPRGWQAPVSQNQQLPVSPNVPGPPAGQPPIHYGYAQAPAPTVPQPPPGDAPIAGAPPSSLPPAPAPENLVDRASAVEGPKQG